MPTTLESEGAVGIWAFNTANDAEVRYPYQHDNDGFPITSGSFDTQVGIRQRVLGGATISGTTAGVSAEAVNGHWGAGLSGSFSGRSRGSPDRVVFHVNPEGEEPLGVPVPIDIETEHGSYVCRGSVTGWFRASYRTDGQEVELPPKPLDDSHNDAGHDPQWCQGTGGNSARITTRVYAKTGDTLELYLSLTGSIDLLENRNELYPSRATVSGGYRLLAHQFDLEAVSLGWNDQSKLIEYAYRFSGSDPNLPHPVALRFYWEGPSGELTLAHERTIVSAGTDTFTWTLPPEAVLPSRPADARFLVLIVDDDNELAETRETNNILRVLSDAVANPVPVVTGLSLASVPEGSPGFFLSVLGTHFSRYATVQWNGTPLTTMFVSGTQLDALVPAEYLADNASHAVGVFNPAPVGGTSNAATFEVTNVPPGLVVLAPSPFDPRSPYTLTFQAGGDPGADTISHWTIDWDDGTTEQVPAGSSAQFQVSHFYPPVASSYTIRVAATDEDGTYAAGGMPVEARLPPVSSLPPPPFSPPPPAIQAISASLVTLPQGKNRRMMVRIVFDGGQLSGPIVSPFQKPKFRGIRAALYDLDGDSVFDSILFTARRGKRKVRQIVPIAAPQER